MASAMTSSSGTSGRGATLAAVGNQALRGRHRREVAGIGPQAAEEAVDEGVLVQLEGRVAASLVGDRRPAAGGHAGRAVRPEPVRRAHRGVGRQAGAEATDRAVLRAGERLGTIASHEVGAAGAAEQQRAAGEHGAGGVQIVRDPVGGVGVGMAGRVEHAHGERSDAQLVAVRDPSGLVAEPGSRGHRVGGPVPEGEREAAGHVVVVEVGLEDVGEPHAVLVREQRELRGRCRAGGRRRRPPARRAAR